VQGQPPKLPARNPATGTACPYCRFPLKEGVQTVVCGVCRAPHHADCWQDNAGCAVTACSGGPAGGAANQPTNPVASPAAHRAAQSPHPLEPAAPTDTPTWSSPATSPTRERHAPSLAIAIIVLTLVVGGSALAIVLSLQGNSNIRDATTSVREHAVKRPGHVNKAYTSRTVTQTVTVPATVSPSTAPDRQPMSWPVGFAGYTVALASDRSRSDALGAASKASSAGLGDVGVVRSSYYSSLTPGYWFVWSGIDVTVAEAEADVTQAEDAGFAGAYVRRVAR
jgi:Prokaryotic RING finger family 1